MSALAQTPPSKLRWIWYAVGVAMIGWGARGLLEHTSSRGLMHAGRLVLVDVVAHDGLFAPAAFVTAYLTQRALPPLVRTPVRVGLAVAAVVALLALPLIFSARRLRSPSILPLPYERNLTIVLLAVALGVAISVLVTLGRSRAAARSRTPGSLPRG